MDDSIKVLHIWRRPTFYEQNERRHSCFAFVALALVAIVTRHSDAVRIRNEVRQDEHHLTKTIHKRYRMRLFAPAVVLLSVSLTVAVNVTGAGMFWILFAGSFLSTPFTLPTILSALYSRARIRRIVRTLAPQQ
jgi:hypothetical protein